MAIAVDTGNLKQNSGTSVSSVDVTLTEISTSTESVGVISAGLSSNSVGPGMSFDSANRGSGGGLETGVIKVQNDNAQYNEVIIATINNPATAQKTVTASASGADGVAYSIIVGWVPLTGIDTGGTPFGATFTGNATSGNSSVSITGAGAGEWTVDTVMTETATIATDQTLIYEVEDVSGTSQGTSYDTSTGSFSVTWTVGGAWAAAALNIKPAAGGGPAATPRLTLLGVG